MRENEKRLLSYALDLSYGWEVPEDTELKATELFALLLDYDEYVQECFNEGIKPATHEKFKEKWNLIFNADLYRMNIGNYVYCEDGMRKEKITSKKVLDDGTVEVTLTNYNDSLCAGMLYKKSEKWEF